MAEFLDHNKGMGHVDKYARLGSSSADAIRKPSEQQHEEKQEHGEMDMLKRGMPSEQQSEEGDSLIYYRVVYKPWVPDYSPGIPVPKEICIPEKSAWLSSWFDVYGSTIEEHDDKIRKEISEVNGCTGRKFDIYVDGYYTKGKKPGYSAIICDDRCKPIVAESRVLSEGEHVSPFYHELQGVILGLELAIHYKLVNFNFFCTSLGVVYFLEKCLLSTERCPTCKGKFESKSQHSANELLCDVCLKSRLPVGHQENEALVLPAIRDFINKVSELESLGLPYYMLRFTTGSRKTTNKVAKWLAKLGVSKRMTPCEIQKNEELTDLLYEEAVRQHKSYGYVF